MICSVRGVKTWRSPFTGSRPHPDGIQQWEGRPKKLVYTNVRAGRWHSLALLVERTAYPRKCLARTAVERDEGTVPNTGDHIKYLVPGRTYGTHENYIFRYFY